LRKLLALSVIGLAVTACQPQQQSSPDIEDLRADVDSLKADIYGKQLGSCDESKILSGPSDYAATLEGLPDAAIEGVDWHTANGERPNVMSTPSGLQYTIVQDGMADSRSPDPTHIVRVNYHGFFKDGKTFDSSYDRGKDIQFPANGVIKGWVEALTDMKPCEARTLYIPGDLAYGSAGRGGIPADATLIFNVQLLGIKEKAGLIDK